jgi:hypothetical protein
MKWDGDEGAVVRARNQVVGNLRSEISNPIFETGGRIETHRIEESSFLDN